MPDPDTGLLLPRENLALFGHERAEAAILAACASGRLPHGWILSGPKGIGKATLAYRFARHLLAGGGEDQPAPADLFGAGRAPAASGNSLATDPGNPAAKLLAAGSHPGLFVLERRMDDKRDRKKSVIAVEDVRAAIGFLHLTAGDGGWRVVIVDSADDLNTSSANALLKILEEPPSKAMVLLVSSSPHALMPTIRSRCRMLRLDALDHASVGRVLAHVAPQLDPGEARLLARLADGSPGRALHLGLAGGADLYREMAGLLASLPAAAGPSAWAAVMMAAHGIADSVARPGQDDAFATVFDIIDWWLGVGLRAGAVGETPPSLAGESWPPAAVFAPGPGRRWLRARTEIGDLLRAALGLNLDRRQVVLDAFGILARAACRPA